MPRAGTLTQQHLAAITDHLAAGPATALEIAQATTLTSVRVRELLRTYRSRFEVIAHVGTGSRQARLWRLKGGGDDTTHLCIGRRIGRGLRGRLRRG